jgi:hypothetical protein
MSVNAAANAATRRLGSGLTDYGTKETGAGAEKDTFLAGWIIRGKDGVPPNGRAPISGMMDVLALSECWRGCVPTGAMIDGIRVAAQHLKAKGMLRLATLKPLLVLLFEP